MRVEPNEPYLRQLSLDAQRRAASALRRNRDGAMVDLVTPLINRSEEPDEGRIHLRDELIARVIPTGYDWLDEAEEDQAGKIGAYSIMLPYVERRADVSDYFKRYPHSVESEILEMAKLQLIERIGLREPLRAVPIKEAFYEMPTGTNLGFPFLSSDKRLRSDVLELAREIEQNGYNGWNAVHDPAFLYWRGQAQGIGEYPKQRVVDGYPHWLTILEMRLQVPLLALLRNRREFASWVSQDRVNYVVTTMLRDAKHDILSVDFKGYDKRLPIEVISAAFDVTRHLFREEYWPLIDFVEERFKNIGLMTPEGIYLGRVGAVPSGSTLTNYIDTVSHELMWLYTCLVLGLQLTGALFQGDDGVVSFNRDWSLDEIKAVFFQHFGMTVNSEKGGVSRERIYFLQNVHSLDYLVDGVAVNVRPIMRVLNGMMSYERMTSREWTGYDDTLRWWQQAENAKWHVKFLALAKFLYEHDVYSRKLSAGQVLEKAGGWKQAESVLRQPSFPFGKESLTNLDNFAIVRVLDSLRFSSDIRVGRSGGKGVKM